MPMPVVSAQWIRERLDDAGVVVLDASWHQAATGRDPRAEFAAAHLPRARFMDLEEAAMPDAPLAHTLPDADHFARTVAALGVTPASLVIIYDNAGLAPSARAWWMFSIFGFGQVHVMDGGLPAWKAAGFGTVSGAAVPVAAAPVASLVIDGRRLAGFEHVRDASAQGRTVLDARPAARFNGLVAEPRPGIIGGHIADSINLPYSQLLDVDTGRLLPRSELSARFAAAGVSRDTPVICSCGSGVTACVLALALESLAHPDVAVYDGSWSDWAQQQTSGAIP